MSRPPSLVLPQGRPGPWRTIGFAASVALAAGSAQAQSASGTLSSFRTGYGAGLSGLQSPISPSLIGSASPYTVSDGVNAAGAVGSVFVAQTSESQTSGSEASSSQSSGGAGQLAGINQRAPLDVVDGATPNAPVSPSPVSPFPVSPSPVSPSAAARAAAIPAATPTRGGAPNELVLNGQLNLDGGQ